MKKLLLLGGSRYLDAVIEAAHRNGIHAITCDYLPKNYAHRLSDEYHNVSIIDREAVLALARALRIDGVISFACDPGVVTAAYVAEALGLPKAGPVESVEILQDKGRFRAFLKAHGFKVPWSAAFSEKDAALAAARDFAYPLIVKPVDSAGSKGVTRVDAAEELAAAVDQALCFSHSGRFIIEEFIEQRGCSSDCDAFGYRGELQFISFSAQRFDREAKNPYAPDGFSWPDTFTDAERAELSSEVKRLLSLLHMETSVYNIETRVGTNGVPYIMECSPRGGGNRLSEMVRCVYGVDLIDAAVRAAVGLPVTGVRQTEVSGVWAEVILHAEAAGTFESLWIDESAAKFVQKTDLWIKPGDAVHGFTGANEAVGTLVMKFDSDEDMQDFLAHKNKRVKIVCRTDENYQNKNETIENNKLIENSKNWGG